MALSNAERQKRWRQAHPEKALKAKARWLKRKRRQKGWKTPRHLLSRCKVYAKSRNLEFKLPKDFFVQKPGELCHLCHKPLDFVRGLMSDPYKGYVEDNMLRLCEVCFHVLRVWRYRNNGGKFWEFRQYLMAIFKKEFNEELERLVQVRLQCMPQPIPQNSMDTM